jgi:PTH1 family peptidyl-tRNA hydrolase
MKLNFWKSSGKTNKQVKLIVGLGNPGREYANSLHNVGFRCVNYFARQHGIRFDSSKGRARVGTGKVDGIDVVAARPQTYMNKSGESVVRLVERFKVDLKDLLVIYDDMDLPPGKIRIRPDGSAGGHNGMKSIIRELGSDGFPRLRVGIGRPENIAEDANTDIISYLLSELPPEEQEAIDKIIPVVNEAIVCAITGDITVVMNKFNSNNGVNL